MRVPKQAGAERTPCGGFDQHTTRLAAVIHEIRPFDPFHDDVYNRIRQLHHIAELTMRIVAA